MRLSLLAATALLLAGADAQACPNLATKAALRRTVAGGRMTTLTVKVANRNPAAVNDVGLGLELPTGITYQGVKVSPKPASTPAFQQTGQALAWTGLTLSGRKTTTFRLKLGVDQCAGDALVPSKHNKTAKPHRELAFGIGTALYSTTITLATFTGSASATPPSCLASQELKVSGGS